MSAIKRPSKEFPAICKSLGYRKRFVYIVPTTSTTIHGVNWCGGSRSVYHGVDLSSGDIQSAEHFSVPAPWNNKYEGATVEILPGKALVKTGVFCGKPSIMFIYVHPSNMPALLSET